MLTAFILAGGKSTRMGTDKAFLEFEGETLLAHALLKAKTVATQVRIVGAREKFELYGPVIEDVFPERGPLGGIHAALESTPTDLNLVLAVDMPFVTTDFLKYLADQARATDALVTLPRAGGQWQPLCAVYRRAFLELAQPALEAGRNRIDALFQPDVLRVIDETELTEGDFDAAMFHNLNRPEDVASTRRAVS